MLGYVAVGGSDVLVTDGVTNVFKREVAVGVASRMGVSVGRGMKTSGETTGTTGETSVGTPPAGVGV